MSTFSVSRTFSEVTPESAETGEYSGTGYVFQDRLMDLEEAVAELSDCCILSKSPVSTSQDLTGREWASTEATVPSAAAGISREESVHIRKADGEPLSPWLLFRIFKMAHLAGG